MKKDFSKTKRRTLPMSRALLATLPDGRKASATWVLTPEYGWKCLSASKPLRWMRGMPHPGDAEYFLKQKQINWHWIVPQGRAVEPPFEG
jgi:hypothetical protein